MGFNVFWMRYLKNIFKIFKELGFIYYIDDLFCDELLLIFVGSDDIVVVLYIYRNNDIVCYIGSIVMIGKVYL